MVYPLTYRRAALGVFGGLAVLWRSDRDAAQAILTHEFAHNSNRDAWWVGTGSGFELVVRYWWILILLFVVTPLALPRAYDLVLSSINSVRQIAAYNEQLAGINEQLRRSVWPELQRTFWIFSTIIVPGMLSIAGQATLKTVAFFIVPVAGIWCSEFHADRYAISHTPGERALLHTVARYERGWRFWSWIVHRVSHPPRFLRLWLARRPDGSAQILLLTALFPAAFFLQYPLLLLMAWLAIWTSQLPFEPLTYLVIWRDDVAPYLIGVAVLLLLWPFVATYLLKRIDGTPVPFRGREYVAHTIVAAVLLGVAATTLFSP
jgi:hypothetical protein